MESVTPVLLKPVFPLPERNLSEGTDHLPLYALVGNSAERVGTCRMKLTWHERLSLLLHGNLWVQQLTFGHHYAPIKLHVSEPDIEECL